jgi:hypothetical protein
VFFLAVQAVQYGDESTYNDVKEVYRSCPSLFSSPSFGSSHSHQPDLFFESLGNPTNPSQKTAALTALCRTTDASLIQKTLGMIKTEIKDQGQSRPRVLYPLPLCFPPRAD